MSRLLLSKALNSGISSTQLKVEDAGYFFDGFGLTSGDEIQLEGHTQKAQIASLDYVTNTITLKTPITWNSGIGVSLPYAGQRPDQGVFEYTNSSTYPPTAPVNLLLLQ